MELRNQRNGSQMVKILFNWKQSVRSCGSTSYQYESLSGVLQGSNLGPLLFLHGKRFCTDSAHTLSISAKNAVSNCVIQFVSRVCAKIEQLLLAKRCADFAHQQKSRGCLPHVRRWRVWIRVAWKTIFWI